MNTHEKEIDMYRKLNDLAKVDCTVIFGGNFAKNIPIGELKQTYGLDCRIYNRSFDDLSVFEAGKLFRECVYEIDPKKIFLQIGEYDLEQGCKIANIISEYKKLIDAIKAEKKTDITIVSVCEANENVNSKFFNAELEKMAKALKCRYVDISEVVLTQSPYIEAFRKLNLFTLEKISFFDVMSIVDG